MAVEWPYRFQPHPRSRVTMDTGVETDQSADGYVRLRALYPESQYDLSLIFPALSADDCAEMLQFLDDNLVDDIDIQIDGIDYRVKQTGSRRVEFLGGARKTITLEMRGVRL